MDLILNRIGGELLVESEGPDRVDTAQFAELLRGFEVTLSEGRPERVVLADDSDRALAAALVAAKLLIPIESTAGASQSASANAAVIAQLVAT